MLDKNIIDEETYLAPYVASDEEKKRVGEVMVRIAAMQQARTAVDWQWATYQTMIDAVRVPYPDERSSSNVPLASSIIELFVAEATKIKTEYSFMPESTKSAANARAFEYVWKHLWKKNNWEKQISKAEYICAWFGNVPLYTWYDKYTKVQSDAKIDPDTWELSREEVTIDKEGVVMKLGDIRQFYMDNQAIEGIEDAADCAYRQWMSFDKFKNFKNNPLYKNIEHVKPCWYSNDWKTFVNQEEAIKEWNYVQIWIYWNVEKDMYIEVANGIEVREHPMVSTIDWEKALPRAWRGLWVKNYSVYSRGLCESLLMFNSEVNTLREMLMDGIRRSNSQVLAIGNGVKFDGRGFSYDNQILTFDGKIGSDNFQQISWTPPNQAIFSYMEQLYRDISIYIGIDIQNVMGEPDLTAYQTEVKRESSQKRMNVYLQNRDMAYQRLAKLLKDQILLFFPKKDAEGMYQELETEGINITQTEEWQDDKIKVKKGTGTFEATPEILRNGKFDIEAYTNTSAPTIWAVDRDQKKAFLTDVGIIAQQLAVAKQSWLDVEAILPINDTLRDLASSYGIVPVDTTWQNEELDTAKKAFMKQLMDMKQSIWQVEEMPEEKAVWEPPLEANPTTEWMPLPTQPELS